MDEQEAPRTGKDMLDEQRRRDRNMHVINIMSQVQAEVNRAEGLHPPLNSLHEGYAVILEELEEVWSEVKKKSSERDLDNVRTELIETAAMCVRTILNVVDAGRNI